MFCDSIVSWLQELLQLWWAGGNDPSCIPSIPQGLQLCPGIQVLIFVVIWFKKMNVENCRVAVGSPLLIAVEPDNWVLSHRALEQGQLRWPIYPKHHQFEHLTLAEFHYTCYFGFCHFQFFKPGAHWLDIFPEWLFFWWEWTSNIVFKCSKILCHLNPQSFVLAKGWNSKVAGLGSGCR